MPNPTSPALLAERRSWSYWFADGLPQVLVGVTALLFGFYFISSGKPYGNNLRTYFTLAAFGFYLIILVRAEQILEWMKARITYPRTGYAASPYVADRDDYEKAASLKLAEAQEGGASTDEEIRRARQVRNRRLLLTYVLIAGSCLAMWLVQAAWICGLTGVMTGTALLLGTRGDKSISWIAVVGFPLMGIAVGALRLAPRGRVGYFVLGAGFLFLLEGLVSMLVYLQRNPRYRVQE
jgi:hypothetical protein